MDWNKINLRLENKNLPPIGERVCWATNENAPSKDTYYKFFGTLTSDGYIETGLKRYKLTSNYWWIRIDNPQ